MERFNGSIWRTVQLLLKSKELDSKYWETVLSDALHCVRSLLCTSINESPHERFFNFTRKSSFGLAMPSWLLNPGNVRLKRHVRPSKHDPLVEEVELLETNPNYAKVKFPNGHESNVSLRHLAPLPSSDLDGYRSPTKHDEQSDDSVSVHPVEDSERIDKLEAPLAVNEKAPVEIQEKSLRSSTRVSRPPDRLEYN